jgi:hypothetical protein
MESLGLLQTFQPRPSRNELDHFEQELSWLGFEVNLHVLLLWPAKWRQHGFGEWLTGTSMRLHHNVLAAALANKLARIAWSVLSQNRVYEPRTAAVVG